VTHIERWGFSGPTGSIAGSTLGHTGSAPVTLNTQIFSDGKLRTDSGGRSACYVQTSLADILGTTPLGNRTMGAFVRITDYNKPFEQGVMGLQAGSGTARFDAIAYGNRNRRRQANNYKEWHVASDGNLRTQRPLLPASATEHQEPRQSDFNTSAYVHIAVTYTLPPSCGSSPDTTCDGQLQIYRNGVPYGDPFTKPLVWYNNRGVADFAFFCKTTGIGNSCPNRVHSFLDCAGLYDRPLTQAEVQASMALGCCRRGVALGDKGTGCTPCGPGPNVLRTACETASTVTETRSAASGLIPRSDIASVIATSVRPPNPFEADNSTLTQIRHGQCQPAFAIDDGDAYFNLPGLSRPDRLGTAPSAPTRWSASSCGSTWRRRRTRRRSGPGASTAGRCTGWCTRTS
jgi:hypothetical protein